MTRPPVIAVLDDEPQLRMALRRLLTAHGYRVLTFERGDDAIVALTVQPTDCLLLDLHMPETSGFEVLEGLSERAVVTPVIVMTGHGEPDTAARVMAMGAAAYLNKPLDESVLLAAINDVIGNRSIARRHFP